MNPGSTAPGNLPMIRFGQQQDWVAWLAEIHAPSTGVWLQIAKKASGLPSVSYDEAVEAAQQDGRWEAAYDPQSTATVPADFQAELDKHPEAKTFFATLESRHHYAILHRLHIAKKAETRARRIQQFSEMLARQEKLYP